MSWMNCVSYPLKFVGAVALNSFSLENAASASLVLPENIDGTLKEIKENRKWRALVICLIFWPSSSFLHQAYSLSDPSCSLFLSLSPLLVAYFIHLAS